MSATFRTNNSIRGGQRLERAYAAVPEQPANYFWHGCKSYWSITSPLGKDMTNYVFNPSFETDADGWGSDYPGVTVSRSAGDAVSGSFAGLVTAIAGAYEVWYGAGQGFSSPHTQMQAALGREINACVWVKGGQGDTITFQLEIDGVLGGTQIRLIHPPTTVKATGDWQLLCSTFKATYLAGIVITQVPVGLRIYNDNGSGANQMRVDRAILSIDGPAQPFDGDDSGAVWNGTPHRSHSTISKYSRAYGEKVNLTDLGLDIIGDEGHGMTTVENLTTGYAIGDGARNQRTRRLPRVITLIAMVQSCDSPTEMHVKRKKLIDALGYKFEGQCNQELILTYQMLDDCCNPMSSPLEIPVLYQGGLEFARNHLYSERIALQFVANQQVYWQSPTDSAVTLTNTGTSTAFTNPGNAPAYPIITLRAGSSAMTINRVIVDTNATAIAMGVPTVGYVIPAGSYIIINTDPRNLSATLYPGNTNITGQINYTNSNVAQFKVTPGDNSMRIEGTAGADAEVAVRYRSQYQSVDSVDIYNNCYGCG